MESAMSAIPQEIEAYQVHHLPIVKAYADKIGVVEVINQLVPTEMDIDPGTIVLGMILDTLRGRSPLYRLHIGKYLSRLCKLDHVIVLKAGFETQLRTPRLSIPFGMSALGMTGQIGDGRLQGGI